MRVSSGGRIAGERGHSASVAPGSIVGSKPFAESHVVHVRERFTEVIGDLIVVLSLWGVNRAERITYTIIPALRGWPGPHRGSC